MSGRTLYSRSLGAQGYFVFAVLAADMSITWSATQRRLLCRGRRGHWVASVSWPSLHPRVGGNALATRLLKDRRPEETQGVVALCLSRVAGDRSRNPGRGRRRAYRRQPGGIWGPYLEELGSFYFSILGALGRYRCRAACGDHGWSSNSELVARWCPDDEAARKHGPLMGGLSNRSRPTAATVACGEAIAPPIVSCGRA